MLTRWHITLSGHVQGVGLRFRAKMAAKQYQITGWIANLDCGDVELEAQGIQQAIDGFLEYIRSLPGVRVEFLHAEEIDVVEERVFRMR